MTSPARTTPLVAALERLCPHDHLCSIYESPEEHYAVVIPFIRLGLARGEKCLYIADDGTLDAVRGGLADRTTGLDHAHGHVDHAELSPSRPIPRDS